MRAILVNKLTPDDDPPHWHLEPETEVDQRTIARLVQCGKAMGYGRDPKTQEFVHAQVAIGT